ncbi:MAG: LuxE/PaaK family acyltransferase [Promethearchaeota archaeon]
MDINLIIKELLSKNQFGTTQSEKNKLLLPIIKEEIRHAMEKSPNLKKFYETLGKRDPDQYSSLDEVPPIPVTMFKKFDLKTCDDEEIVRVLHSSATTTGIPSKIYINKETAFRQSKALITILKNYLGKKRRPILVIDTENVNKSGSGTLTARGAAIRGISNFGKKVVYVMDEIDGELYLNVERLEKFIEEFRGQEILVSGFTYIIWTRFVSQLKETGVHLDFPDMKLVHSGGWKKLKNKSVTKKIFSETLARIFNTAPKNIIDFYGMVEQLGVVFLDCEHGNKHVPDFAEIITRDAYTMKETPIGTAGLIEIMSIIPSSYPGQAIITEDVGVVLGVDDCPCGRKGKYFRFQSRVERTETRGCGDTFAERRKDK